ncbi:MAG TPA: 23S rRNA (adenine(2503)-C(2))-methyltransferase RlmN [Candidatus Acidoferrales bacterium]|nr:23S rRNA (adenine(2503)-C(2))-methyltransferase RlmN [Candidatus Acidoferrales bacterium]
MSFQLNDLPFTVQCRDHGGSGSRHPERACYHDFDMPPQAPASKINLLGKDTEELRAYMQSIGEPAYRGAQLHHALYAEQRLDFAEMTNLPASLRQRLARDAAIALPRILRRHRSSDEAVRYVLALPLPDVASAARKEDAATIETVFMPEENRQTICISTQAGCAVNCHFCLTATLGLIRNLSTGEILGEVLVALEDNRSSLKPQTNIVLMGQGEPLLNYDAVHAALRILLDSNGMALSPKHVTLSTSGIVPGIERLATENVRPKLAISLNASSNEQREQIMPINRKYPIEQLLESCKRYPLRSWEHLTFEYVVLGGFNDSPEDARRVVKLLSHLRVKINLIPWNPGNLPYERPDPARVEEFRKILTEKGMPTFVRYSRGQDVMAACGQLALLESTASPSPV